MKKRPGMEVCLLMKASGRFSASTRQERLGWGDVKKKRKGGKGKRREGEEKEVEEGRGRKEKIVDQ